MLTGISFAVFILVASFIIIFLTYRFRLNPFYILIPASFILGMISGLSPSNTIIAVRNGFGATIGYYGILIICGTAITVVMEKTGAITTIASEIIKIGSKEKSALVLTAGASILSVSSPSESGFILFAPIAKFLEKENNKRAGGITIILATGIYTVHSLLPPSGAPLAAAGILNAGILKIMFIGIISSAAGIAASYLWCAKFIPANSDLTNQIPDKKFILEKDLPSLGLSVIPVVTPLFLIILKSITTLGSRPFGNSRIASFFEFFGDPSVALLTGLFLSLVLMKRKDFGKIFSEWCAESIERSARVLVIAGSGGAFGAVLKSTSVTKIISENMTFTGAGLLLPFMIAATIKTVNGSSTIAIITASSISASIAASTGLDPAFTVAAVMAGSMVVSHANDPYFWLVSQYSGVDTRETYKYFTTSTLISGIGSFAVIWILSLIF